MSVITKLDFAVFCFNGAAVGGALDLSFAVMAGPFNDVSWNFLACFAVMSFDVVVVGVALALLDTFEVALALLACFVGEMSCDDFALAFCFCFD